MKRRYDRLEKTKNMKFDEHNSLTDIKSMINKGNKTLKPAAKITKEAKASPQKPRTSFSKQPITLPIGETPKSTFANKKGLSPIDKRKESHPGEETVPHAKT